MRTSAPTSPSCRSPTLSHLPTHVSTTTICVGQDYQAYGHDNCRIAGGVNGCVELVRTFLVADSSGGHDYDVCNLREAGGQS
jgi:hypothetical protein